MKTDKIENESKQQTSFKSYQNSHKKSSLLIENAGQITMSNVLERLVAKGRRIHHARDQREVAFGLADLSTHEELHHRIVRKGGVKTLIHLLTTSRDVEAQRFSALALANTSCAELHRVEIALQENSLMHLTEYIRNEEADIVGRQYCAMALGNLAADPENHSNIAMIGGIEALMILLKLGAKEQDLESGRFAAFSLSNLAANSNYRKQIVDEGAIEPLILLACSDDYNVQRQALAALRGICISSEYRVVAVEAGILDPLVLMARSENVEIIREVAAALNCLSSAVENKEEVSDRAISTIIVMLLKGDRIVERHACCAIANLAEISENHSRLLDENGLPPIVATFASKDLNCKGEAARALANLSANAEVHSHLLTEEILYVVIEALKDTEINCQRFAALCLANLATTVSSQIKIVQEGAVRSLVQLVRSNDVQLEARRYAALALANLSATIVNHEVMIEEKALEALFSLSNSPDVLSQYYVACTLANLGSNADVHAIVVQEGGIQPLIALAYSEDPDVHLNACAALRGLSATGDIKMKIVQEGGLEPISRLLLSKDMILLREATGCLCNLSLGDENRIELTKSGIVTPLITLMQHEDMQIAIFCCACLANLAEILYSQEIIVCEGAIKACIAVMRSRYLDVQREGGRLLANLCACDLKAASDKIVENGGHHLLISYLLSRDTACQRVGAFGIGNLCTHERHRVTLKDSRVLEPLSTLVRSDDVNIEIQKFAMLAIVNLSHEVKNHSTFIDDRILQVMISLSNSNDYEIRQYAALAVTNIAKNMDLRNVITEEGGLEPVLYLARIENSQIRREVLAAIATLSFVEKNKEDICFHGGMKVIIHELKKVDGDPMLSRLAFCAIANLSERIGNMHAIVTDGAIPILIEKLRNEPTEDLSEAFRALGNLATNIDYGLMIMKSKAVLTQLISTLTHGSADCRRMSAMALSNLAANSKFHKAMIDADILDPIIDEFRISLDTKFDSDHETTRFCLLLTANLCTKTEFHYLVIERTLDSLFSFTRHRDIKCRQNAIITIGNLCSQLKNSEDLGEAGVLPILVSYAFPPVETDTTDAQFQAIAGLRGVAVNDEMRLKLVKAGCCEPLILAAGDECAKTMDIEIRREAAAAMFNLSLSKQNSLIMAQSGIVSALVSLMKTNDTIAQVYAVGTLANLAEKGGAVQSRLLQDGCLSPLLRITESSFVADEIKKEVSRCLALFANVIHSHDKLMSQEPVSCIFELLSDHNSAHSRRFASLTFANLTLSFKYHDRLAIPTLLSSLWPLLSMDDSQTHQCVAFALHNISKNIDYHDCCEKNNVANMITRILGLEDEFSKLHGCLALRYISVSKIVAAQFIQCDGLPKLFLIAAMGNLEQKLEAAACLRNLSLADENKVRICREGGMAVLTDLTRSEDEQLAHQACGVLANLAEAPVIQQEMVHDGILHHLKFALRSRATEVVREALRVLCNLSTDFSCTELIINAGTLVPLIQSLSSKEILCRRFASMTLSNLATNRDIQPRLVEEGAIEPLFFVVSQGEQEDEEARQHAFIALTNISASKGHHEVLRRCNIIKQSLNYLQCSDPILVSSAALCLSNLASNAINHESLKATGSFDEMEIFLSRRERELKLRALSFIRGLSASSIMRNQLIRPKMTNTLLEFATVEDVEIQIEAIAAICNLSLSGNIGSNPHSFLNGIQMNNLISFLCSADSVSRLFGALVIGNIASESELQDAIVESGAMDPLIRTAKIADFDSQRCIAYTICNMCADPANRAFLAREGGLLPVFSLGCSDDSDDVLAAMSTIRALSSCKEIREFIVDSGGLEPIFNVCQKYDDEDCVQEAIEALCWLSLHENNKTSIVKHVKFGVIYELATSKNTRVSSVSLRCLSSCSEKESLHRDMVHEMSSTFIDIVAADYHINTNIQELSCFVTNLCSNHSNHLKLFEFDVMKSLVCMGDAGKCVTTRNIVLALLNISTNVETHTEMMKTGEDLIQLLFRFCRLQGDSIDTNEIKVYSCATIGCLLTTGTFYAMLLDFGVPALLNELVRDEDEETAFISSFAVHQLVKKNDGVEACKNIGIETSIVQMISHFNSNLAIHAVCSLRYMSVDKDIAKMIISNEGLSALVSVTKNATDEIEREIAATLCNLSLCQEGKSAITESQAFGCLSRLCQRDDSECSRFALGSLANCAEDPNSHSTFLGNGDIVLILTKTMKHKVLSLRREASRAISNILTSEKATSLFLSGDGLISINTLMRCPDCEVQYSVALSLRKLASKISNHELIVANGTLRTILHMCSIKSNTSAILQSIIALRDCASNRAMKVLIMDAGGITIALNSLSSTDSSVRAVSAAVLHHLSISSVIKYPLYDNGVLYTLCERILENLDYTDFLHHAACVLSNLAEHVKVKEFLWERKIVDALTAMADTFFTIVHVQVARCICFMSTVVSAVSKKTLGIKAMQIAIKLVSSDSRQVANDAVTAVGNFSKDAYGQMKVGELHAFEPIVNLVKCNERGVECNLHACWTLSRLVIPEENKPFCNMNSSLLPCLINLCSAKSEAGCLFASMALCNVSACKATHSQVLSSGGVTVLLSLLLSSCNETISSSIKALCNLSTSCIIRHQIVCENGINTLLRLVDSEDMKCKELAAMALCNLIIGREFSTVVAATSAIDTFSNILHIGEVTTLQETCALMMYNLSTNRECHQDLVSITVLTSIMELCKNRHADCKRFAMMILCNLAANDSTRNKITRNGALQASIIMLRDSCPQCRTYACICLANLANDKITQSQAVLHGGLSGLTELLSDKDVIVRKSAMLCLVNVAANPSNHNALLSQETVKAIHTLWINEADELAVYAACSFVNLVSSDDLIDMLGALGGVEVLMNLASSRNYHCQCAATAALRRITETADNRKRLIHSKILNTLKVNGTISELDIQREVAACLQNLSRDPIYRSAVTDSNIPTLLHLLESNDTDTLHSSAASLAYLAENDECRARILYSEAAPLLVPLLEHDCTIVYREVSRAISNLLSSCEIHDLIIKSGLYSLLQICADPDRECQYNASLACRKIAVDKKSHPLMMTHASVLMSLVASKDFNTRKHALTTLRDLSSNSLNRQALVELNSIQALVPLLDDQDALIQTVAAATLHHLSSDCDLKSIVMADDIIVKAASAILGASEHLLLQLAGLIANLSEEDGNRLDMVEAGVVPALAVISRSNSCHILQNVSRALAHLSAKTETQFKIHQQGGMACLMNLCSTTNDTICQQYVAIAIQLLCTCSGVRKALVREKGLSPFIYLSSHPSMKFQHCAAVSICLITSEESSRVYVVTEALNALLKLCTNTLIRIQREAICAIANLADSLDTHQQLVNDRVVEKLKEVATGCVDSMVVRDITRFFASISINSIAKEQMMDYEVLSYLMKFSRRTDTATQRYSSLAMCNLSLHSKHKEHIVGHDGLLNILIFLGKCSDLEVERCAILTMAALALGTTSCCKETIANAGTLHTILKAMRYPETLMKQCSSLALNSLVLSETDSIKIKVNGIEEDLPAILSLLNTSDEECVHNGVYAIGSMVESAEVRRTLISRGCIKAIVKITPSASIEVKRACGYFFSVLAECVEYHAAMAESSALACVVQLAGLVDLECQLYGAFSLVFLASNPDLQVPLVKLGAVRHLVSMMETESEPRHYAGLALLKLADNFENHIQIAEEGGIQALLKLGRSRVADDEVQYKASITVGSLASKAVANLPKLSRNGIGAGASSFRKNSIPKKKGSRVRH